MRAVAAGAVVSLLLLATAACSDDDGPDAADGASASAGAADAGGPVVAEIGTNRLYAIDRAFGLALRNVGDEPVVVRAVQLAPGPFASPPDPAPTDVQLEPGGRRFVVPLPYGDAVCDGDESGFRVRVTLDDGSELELDAPEEYDGAVARLHDRECAAADVRERVDITFGAEWTIDGFAIHGELLLSQRHEGPPVAVDDAVGNVIFTLLVDEAHPVVQVDDDAPAASVAVTFSADRCDPHAVAEFKTPFKFLSWVSVDGAPTVPVELEATGAARQALQDLIATCSV